jgi:hypothetical protein
MKLKKISPSFLIVFIVLIFFQLSCSPVQKSAVSCPEFSIKKNTFASRSQKNRHSGTTSSIKNKRALNTASKRYHAGVTGKKQAISGLVAKEENIPGLNRAIYTEGLMASTDNIIFPVLKTTPELSRAEFKVNPGNSEYSTQDKCDTIRLKSGMVLTGKVEEIGITELRYRKCDNLAGPIISILKTEISTVIYSNGTRDLFGPYESPIPSQNTFSNMTANTGNNPPPRKAEGLGVAGFILSLVGLFIFGLPFGLTALIFGSISLNKIRTNRQKYSGKGFAITSIILGILDIVGVLIVLASM